MPRLDVEHRNFSLATVFAFLFLALAATHWPLLRLPYFWDEAGYYVPAARDLLLTGSFIPHTTPSNAHPPLVMAWLALCWKILGYSPFITRVAMLAVAAFSLTGLFRLARRIANVQVAIASVICTAVYPVFFAQSSMSHVDLAAAGFTFWALDAYFAENFIMTAFWFSLAALAKETAILGPAGLFGWELIRTYFISGRPVPYRALCDKGRDVSEVEEPAFNLKKFIALAIPILPLALWYAYHYSRTGFVFGNPEFFRYNVASTMNPLRIFLALLMRLYQTLGYMNLFVLTITAALAMKLQPLKDGALDRPRIAIADQLALLSVIATYVLALSVIGGAVLARYMLPVVPLVIIICVSTLWRRFVWWKSALACVALAFALGLFINPPHGFSPEDNLAYADFIRLHQNAENFLQAHYLKACVLTAWPANDELTQPFLGYVSQPMCVVRIENFAAEEIVGAAMQNVRQPSFNVALVFSTKYDPPGGWFQRWPGWQSWKIRFFGYHRDLPPDVAAQILGGKLVYRANRNGQWAGVIEINSIEDAALPSSNLLR